MAGNNKGLVEQMIDALCSLFSLFGNDKANSIVKKMMQCMLAFIVFIFILGTFLNAVGMGGDILGGILTPVLELMPFGGETPKG